MILFETGSATTSLSETDLRCGLNAALEQLGSRSHVCIVPPDTTRSYSRAGILTRISCEYFKNAVETIVPALGTHAPMSPEQLDRMFGKVPHHLFKNHLWRRDCMTAGAIPETFINTVSSGMIQEELPVSFNVRLVDHAIDLILSIGQVVPHEVAGMANHSKNLLVGLGGKETIDATHFLGAVHGIERTLGLIDTPVRRVFNRAMDLFLGDRPIVYVLTVVDCSGEHVRGLFIGTGIDCFEHAAQLAQEVDITIVEKPVRKAVVWLDPQEYRSTWLGNKAVYRTRLCLADGGEVVILAPGVQEFGEDASYDSLIRKYGYRGTPATIDALQRNTDLSANRAVAAHLIHGSTEGRFRVRWCPGHLSKTDIESVGYEWGDLDKECGRYGPHTLKAGFNRSSNGEELFFVKNPGLGLWAVQERFFGERVAANDS